MTPCLDVAMTEKRVKSWQENINRRKLKKQHNGGEKNIGFHNFHYFLINKKK
jgi:hypothetical protein